MSRGVDDRDEGKGFLGRWSQRKAQARALPDSETPEAADAVARKDVGLGEDGAPLAGQLKKDEEVFDLSKLPSLDEITGQTSLSDFMRKEVPAALRNAALKKAWALDPAIRDYVNPAREYAYDWNTPGGVPGNGPIDTAIETLREMVASAQSTPTAHTFGERESTDVTASAPEADISATPQEPSAVRLSDNAESSISTDKTEAYDNRAELGAEARVVPADELPKSRRRHGGAAPG